MPSPPFVVRLLPAARRDLLEIATLIAADKPQASLKYLDKLHARLQSLSSHPKMGHLPRDPYLKSKGYRILVIDAYLAFYVLHKRTVKIRRILYGARDMKSIVL